MEISEFVAADMIGEDYRAMVNTGMLSEHSLRRCGAGQLIDIALNLAASTYSDQRATAVPPYPGEKPSQFFNAPIPQRLRYAACFLAAEIERLEIERQTAIQVQQEAAARQGPSPEECVVGWIMQNGENLDECAQAVTAMMNRFPAKPDPQVKLVFQTILALVNEGHKCTVFNVSASLQYANCLCDARGIVRLMEIVRNAWPRERVVEYLQGQESAHAQANGQHTPVQPHPAQPAQPAQPDPQAHVASSSLEQAVIDPSALNTGELQQLFTRLGATLIDRSDGGLFAVPVIERNGRRYVMGFGKEEGDGVVQAQQPVSPQPAAEVQPAPGVAPQQPFGHNPPPFFIPE